MFFSPYIYEFHKDGIVMLQKMKSIVEKVLLPTTYFSYRYIISYNIEMKRGFVILLTKR